METKTTYFLVDEQAIFRHCVRFMLDKEENLTWVGDADNGIEAIGKIKACRPDVVVMDFFLPKLNGVSVMKEIKNHSPRTKVIVLSSDDSDENVLAAFKGGANAYCLKNESFSELLRAIQQVAAGHTYLGPEIAGKVLIAYANERDLRGDSESRTRRAGGLR